MTSEAQRGGAAACPDADATAAVDASPVHARRLQVRRRRHGWAFQAVWAGIGASCALAVLGWGLWRCMAHLILDGAGAGWTAWAWLGSAILAFGLDACWGEWPSRWHPVAWLGQAAQRWQGAWSRQPSAAVARVAGRRAWWQSWVVLMVAVTGVQGAGWAVLCLWPGAPGAVLAAVLWALLLKPGMAGRMLLTEVQAVSDALARSVADGRQRLSWLVSRDTAALDEVEIREAAIETLSENLVDAWVAPWWWWLLAGPVLWPWAVWTYRHANTLDAMWGYRDGRKHWGRHAARADDVLSAVPARLTGWLLCAVAGRPGGSRRWAAWPEERDKTPSPNGGWPMSAAALALDVRLRKPSTYDLHPAGRPADAAKIGPALRLVARSGIAGWLLAVLAAAGWVGMVGLASRAPLVVALAAGMPGGTGI